MNLNIIIYFYALFSKNAKSCNIQINLPPLSSPIQAFFSFYSRTEVNSDFCHSDQNHKPNFQ